MTQVRKLPAFFPETKETRDPQMKYQQLHSATYQPPSAMSHDNKLKENTQEATDSESSTNVSPHLVTRVGLVKNSNTGQVKGTRLINKEINSCVIRLNTSSA